jgi:hypothetical protein
MAINFTQWPRLNTVNIQDEINPVNNYKNKSIKLPSKKLSFDLNQELYMFTQKISKTMKNLKKYSSDYRFKLIFTKAQ